MYPSPCRFKAFSPDCSSDRSACSCRVPAITKGDDKRESSWKRTPCGSMLREGASDSVHYNVTNQTHSLLVIFPAPDYSCLGREQGTKNAI